ncbi:hypothetical protein LCGC14_0589780 [marine sediment metagenome]|uniref:Uncharacterized protein n=1 Tax=marine sediment metagenome TaxID=412755 RepID=A0A0F9RIU6_9ZZZZ
MPERTLQLQFPLGGVDKRLAFQTQRPFTTPHAVNVRPEGTLENRLRGGSRPGIVKSFSTRDSDNKVNLLTVMRSLNSEGRVTFTEPFSDALSSTHWEATLDALNIFPGGLVTVGDGVGLFASGSPNTGALLKITSGAGGEVLSDVAPYSVEALIDFSEIISGIQHDLDIIFSFYIRLADVTPSATPGLRCDLWYQMHYGISSPSPRYSLFVKFYNDGALVKAPSFTSTTTQITSGRFVVSVDGDTISAAWIRTLGSGGVDFQHEVIMNTVSTGKRVAFGATLFAPTEGSGALTVDNFVLRYISTGGGVPPEAVMQATNGILRRESTDGTLATVTQANITLASDRALLAVDYLGKLYIADYGNRFSTDGSEEARQIDGVIASSNSGERLVSDTITDWTDMGIEASGDWLEIISATGNAADVTLAVGVHRLATQSNAGYLELATGIGNAGNLIAITYRVTRGPKVYDSSTDAMTIWVPDDGSIPLGCSIIEIFRERMVLSGDPENHGALFMGRYRNPLDFNYGASATDRGRALPGNLPTSELGGLTSPVSAIAAITEDYLMVSAESELYLLRGDPAMGGIGGDISNQIGIGSRTAWCRIPDGSLIFLSRDGLYSFHPSQPFPQNISREKLPDELIDVVQNTDITVTLEYDVRFRGILIFIAPSTVGPTTHYWFDWTTKSFWPEPLGSSDYEPFAIAYDAKANRVLLGCRDGYIRHFDAGSGR